MDQFMARWEGEGFRRQAMITGGEAWPPTTIQAFACDGDKFTESTPERLGIVDACQKNEPPSLAQTFALCPKTPSPHVTATSARQAGTNLLAGTYRGSTRT